MNRRESVLALLAMGTAGEPVSVFAQEPRAGAPFRIGLLPDFGPAWQPWLKIISKGLGEFGRIEGRDFVFYPSGLAYGEDFQPALARFIDTKPDLILAVNLAYAVALKRAGVTTIPVVLLISGLPVESGVAESLTRPGRNVTGLMMYSGVQNPAHGVDHFAKLVQLLHEAVPRIRRIGALMTYVPPFHERVETDLVIRGMQSGVRSVGLDLRMLEIAKPEEVDAALAAATAQGVDALLLTGGVPIQPRKADIMKYAVARRLPTIVDTFGTWSLVEPGPLLAYGALYADVMRQAAPYVNQILWHRVKPGELPIQMPSRFEFVVNQKTARAIGVTVPPSILVRADRVIG